MADESPPLVKLDWNGSMREPFGVNASAGAAGIANGSNANPKRSSLPEGFSFPAPPPPSPSRDIFSMAVSRSVLKVFQ